MQIIDAHQHFWKYHPVTHSWITDEMTVLKKNYLPADLVELYDQCSVSGCISVQADQSEAETQLLVDLSSDYKFIKGVVGWVDLRADNIHEKLATYKQFKILKGFRHVLQSEGTRDMMLGADFRRGIKALEEYGYTYDLLVLEDQLHYSAALVGLYPNQRFVLDHIAKPDIRNKKMDDWKKGIITLAKNENVFCKISGMVTEAGLDNWVPVDFVPYMDVIVEYFGINRIMFGSDWPVCLLAGSYGEILDIVQSYFSTFTVEDQQKVFAGNAIEFYKI